MICPIIYLKKTLSIAPPFVYNKSMSKIYISKLAGGALREYLQNHGHTLRVINGHPNVDTPISCHPDIYMCRIGDKTFHGNPELLSSEYPGDAIYNACSTGKFFIHNLKITESELLQLAESTKQIKVHVSQGYTKCSCVAVDESSIITSDRGIEQAAKKAGMDVLLVEPAQVILPGYKYGFLGGASGRIGDEIVFNGDLAAHSDYEEIKSFIQERGLRLVYFRQYPLTDIGSIIEESE